VPDYQIRLFNRRGDLVRTVTIEFDDDDDARNTLALYAGVVPTELWQGERLVEHYRAIPGSALKDPKV
jgi:hypothetical protein